MAEHPERARERILAADDTAGTALERRHARHVDELVARAEAEGRFQGLAGRGRPLAFRAEEGLATLDERWLANHLLKNADYVPPWAEAGRAVEAARASSAQALEQFRSATADEAAARTAALSAAWEAENAAIRVWNGQVPDPSLQRYPIPLTRRWERLREQQRAGG